MTTEWTPGARFTDALGREYEVLDAKLLDELSGCGMADALRLIPAGTVVLGPIKEVRRLRRDCRRPAPLSTTLAAAIVGESKQYLMYLVRGGRLLAVRRGASKYQIATADLARWAELVAAEVTEPLPRLPTAQERRGAEDKAEFARLCPAPKPRRRRAD